MFKELLVTVIIPPVHVNCLWSRPSLRGLHCKRRGAKYNLCSNLRLQQSDLAKSHVYLPKFPLVVSLDVVGELQQRDISQQLHVGLSLGHSTCSTQLPWLTNPLHLAKSDCELLNALSTEQGRWICWQCSRTTMWLSQGQYGKEKGLQRSEEHPHTTTHSTSRLNTMVNNLRNNSTLWEMCLLAFLLGDELELWYHSVISVR